MQFCESFASRLQPRLQPRPRPWSSLQMHTWTSPRFWELARRSWQMRVSSRLQALDPRSVIVQHYTTRSCLLARQCHNGHNHRKWSGKWGAMCLTSIPLKMPTMGHQNTPWREHLRDRGWHLSMAL